MIDERKKAPSLISGVLLLSAANLGVKIIGLLFKIPLSHLLGDEGMGYFNAAYTVYSWLYVISTAGLPVAMSILISRADKECESGAVGAILRTSMRIFLFIGLLGSAFMILLSAPLSAMIGNAGSVHAIKAIAPTLFFISIAGGLRGYFQGKRQMLPTAMSQLLEAAGKLALGLLFGGYALRQGYALPIVAAYAILGVTVGVAIGMLYLGVLAILDRQARGGRGGTYIYNRKESTRSLFSIALPITLSSAVTSLGNLIDLIFIMNLLPRAGYSASESTAIFGNYTTLVVPMAHMPTVLIYPIASSLVPFLSAELASGDREKAVKLSETALRFVSIITLPAALFLGVYGERVLSLVFPPLSASRAAPVLASLAPSIFFLGITTVTNAILEANGRAGATLRSMLLGSLVKVILGFLLIGNPSFGIYGATVGTVACYALTSILNLMAIGETVGRLPSGMAFFAKPFAASGGALLASVLLAIGLSEAVGDKTLTLLTVLFAAGVYPALLSLLRALTPEDIAHVPLLSRLSARIFRNHEGKKAVVQNAQSFENDA